jgi:polyhydroxyalkanoate synthesis regulator phasin
MAQSSEFDPVAAWQTLVSQWERQANALSAKLSSSEEFAGPMNQASKIGLAARQSFEEAMGKFVQSMQLASGAQMQSLAERLDRIEQQLAEISAAVRAGSNAPAAPEPRRTRKPPGATQ